MFVKDKSFHFFAVLSTFMLIVVFLFTAETLAAGTTVTVTGTPNVSYGFKKWQATVTFGGLTANTPYYVYARSAYSYIYKRLSGTHCMLRGGSWGHTAQNARSAYRYYSVPHDHTSNSGFRAF